MKIYFISFFNNQLCIKLLNNVTVLHELVHAVLQCIEKGLFLNMTSFDNWFHSSSRPNQITSLRHVPLWRVHQVYAEDKTNLVCLIRPDPNPIEQLRGENWRRIRGRLVQPQNLRQLQVALH